MPETTKEHRTKMYSYKENKDGTLSDTVIVHQLPFNANEKIGMGKLQKFVKRGFMFNDPRVKGGNGQPEVLVTREVDLGKPDVVESEEELSRTPEVHVPAWGYFCTKCESIHNQKSSIGQRHLKHKRL